MNSFIMSDETLTTNYVKIIHLEMDKDRSMYILYHSSTKYVQVQSRNVS